jgi:hypothetical protein
MLHEFRMRNNQSTKFRSLFEDEGNADICRLFTPTSPEGPEKSDFRFGRVFDRSQRTASLSKKICHGF